MNEPDLPANILDLSTLPTLPQTLVDLIDASEREDSDIQELGAIVARDVFISTRVLQLVNSAFIGARSSFADIVQAVIYLGIDTTRNLAISVAVQEAFKTACADKILNLNDFWQHSFLTAVLAKSLAQAIGGVDPSEAYLAGLLHDIGKLLLLQAFPESYRQVLDGRQSVEIAVREKEALGITHFEAAALLIGSWRLRPEIAVAVASHHHGFGRIMEASLFTKVLFCANHLAQNASSGFDADSEALCDILAIQRKALQTCTRESVNVAREIAEKMGIAAGKGAAAAGDASPVSRIDGRLADRVRTASRLNGFLDSLVRADSLDRVYQVVEESLQILFAIDSSLFLLPGDTAGELTANGSDRNPIPARVKGLRIHSNQPGMIGCCLEQLAVLDSVSFVTGHALGPEDRSVLEMLGAGGLMAVPVCIAGHEPGCLLMGVPPAGMKCLRDQDGALMLLAGHAGMRFRLETAYRKNAEDLAATRMEAVSEVARSIAHEISSPIAVLLNYLAVLELKLKDYPALLADLERAGREIGRIGEISEQLRDLSGQTAELTREPVDIKSLLVDIITFFRQSLANRHSVDVILSLEDGLPGVSSNGKKIRQILGNLIKNAIEAIGEAGLVQVRGEIVPLVGEGKAEVRISIEDDGPGVLLSNVEDIFHAGITTKNDGHAGLGLAIVRTLATELGGIISCDKGLRGGMVFTLTLPV
ncbi:MAG: HDOD domain-containing protein [Desulfocapsaceae bacterium]|nr:HDOD domain-containing protein [Desulfocapsaceae bacterium]